MNVTIVESAFVGDRATDISKVDLTMPTTYVFGNCLCLYKSYIFFVVQFIRSYPGYINP